MLSLITSFIAVFISLVVYLFTMKTFRTYFIKTLIKQKEYYLKVEPPTEDELDYTAQLNYFNKMVFTFIILTFILIFVIDFIFKNIHI